MTATIALLFYKITDLTLSPSTAMRRIVILDSDAGAVNHVPGAGEAKLSVPVAVYPTLQTELDMVAYILAHL